MRDSSPSTKTGVAAMKCAPTTGAPAFKDRTRSAREGIEACVSITSGDAAFEALADFLFGQIAADEHNPAVAFLISPHRPLVIAIKDHVHALKDESLRIVLEGKDPLAAQDTGSIVGDEILNPGKKFVGTQWFVSAERHALHFFVVIVLETIAMMMVVGAMIMMAVVVMMIVVMVMMMIFAFEKIRFDIENAIEVERIAAEHFIDVDLRALRSM